MDAIEFTPGSALAHREEQLPAAGGGSVDRLLELAITNGIDVEALERLVALKERVAERDARAAFFAALAAFQEECPEIAKSRKAEISSRSGANYSYQYAPLEEITRTVLPLLKKHGLSYSWDTEDAGDRLTVVCVLRHIDGHETRARFPVPIDSSARMSDAQKLGAALTYGRRQTLISVLGLTTADEDTDDADTRRRASAQTITEAQAADLEALLEETGKSTAKLLKWLGVSSIAEISVTDYPRAIRALRW